jgi:ribosomal protein L16 Arg81 hydroxylase
MAEHVTELPNLREMLGDIDVEHFFADYWQQQTLTTALRTEDFERILAEIGPLEIARFCGTAREGARAWLANEFVAHSVIPVDAANAQKLFDIGATLYFIDVPLERLTNSVADFLGAPRQKLIASLFLTPVGGGAVPHFDKNENFTIQLTGNKEWKVGTRPAVPAPPDGYVLGQAVPPSLASLLQDSGNQPSQSVQLRPGNLLYIPRGAIHTTSGGPVSWSLNLSYSPAMWLDLLLVGLRRRLAPSERWRRTVTGAGQSCDSSASKSNILPDLIGELRDLLADPAQRDQLSHLFLEHPDG